MQRRIAIEEPASPCVTSFLRVTLPPSTATKALISEGFIPSTRYPRAVQPSLERPIPCLCSVTYLAYYRQARSVRRDAHSGLGRTKLKTRERTTWEYCVGGPSG